MEDTMYDLIIIGSGPAGLSAAVYGKRAGLNILVMEKNPMSGGQVLTTYEVDNYLGMPGVSGFDMGMQFRAHADKLGVEFCETTVESIEDKGDFKTVKTQEKEFRTKAVLLASGAEHAKLGVPGEEEFAGLGVSYCATCDGAFFRGKTVAVIGGGDVALEDAIYLARICEKVYVIHRRDEFRGARVLQQELFGLSNISVLYSHAAVKIQGNEMVESLTVKDLKTGEESQLSVSGVFIAVGIRPNTQLLENITSRDEAGYILAGEDGVTDRPGIFVAGDTRKKPLRQIVTAVADGANAAISAASYCSQN
nr:thioredoxin-disulfide reductase [uncultured Acetatifactor sp.]